MAFENRLYRIQIKRKFVIQLYLNDNFDGGETKDLYQNGEIPKEGDVLIFPCRIHSYTSRNQIYVVKKDYNNFNTNMKID